MAQKKMLRAEVYARALRATQNAKRAEVLVGARCALRVGGAWASAGMESGLVGCALQNITEGGATKESFAPFKLPRNQMKFYKGPERHCK